MHRNALFLRVFGGNKINPMPVDKWRYGLRSEGGDRARDDSDGSGLLGGSRHLLALAPSTLGTQRGLQLTLGDACTRFCHHLFFCIYMNNLFNVMVCVYTIQEILLKYLVIISF